MADILSFVKELESAEGRDGVGGESWSAEDELRSINEYAEKLRPRIEAAMKGAQNDGKPDNVTT